MYRILIYMTMLLLVLGCAIQNSNRPPFVPQLIPEGKSLIYVYRPSQFINSAGYPYTYIDGNKMAPLYNGSYKAYVVNAGKHTVETIGTFFLWGLPDNKLEIVVENGKAYYVRLTSGVSSGTIIGSSVYIGKSLNYGGVVEATALEELRYLDTPEELEVQWKKNSYNND